MSYQGRQRFSWTVCAYLRHPHFVTAEMVDPVLLHFLHAATQENVGILAYCFMPDHVHLLLEGLTDQSRIEEAVSYGKQLSGYWFRKETGGRLWQRSSWDRALRDDEDTFTVIRYILANPVRAGLVEQPSQYPFSGSGVYSNEQLESAFHLSAG